MQSAGAQAINMGTEIPNPKDERNTPEYLSQLLKDKKQIQAFPNVFLHLERLLDDGKWRNLLQVYFSLWLGVQTWREVFSSKYHLHC